MDALVRLSDDVWVSPAAVVALEASTALTGAVVHLNTGASVLVVGLSPDDVADRLHPRPVATYTDPTGQVVLTEYGDEGQARTVTLPVLRR